MTPQQQQTRLLLGAWIVAGAITACVRAPRTQLTIFIALMAAVCGLAVYGAYVFRLRRHTSRLR